MDTKLLFSSFTAELLSRPLCYATECEQSRAALKPEAACAPSKPTLFNTRHLNSLTFRCHSWSQHQFLADGKKIISGNMKCKVLGLLLPFLISDVLLLCCCFLSLWNKARCVFPALLKPFPCPFPACPALMVSLFIHKKMPVWFHKWEMHRTFCNYRKGNWDYVTMGEEC